VISRRLVKDGCRSVDVARPGNTLTPALNSLHD